MKKIITYLSILLLSGGVFYEMYSNLNGASSQTGAANIGELSCSQSGCHGAGNGENSLGGLADNAGGGSVVISGIGGTYTPGTVYHVTVTVNQTGAGRFGFNCEILDASGGNVGTYSITQTGTWLRAGMNGTRQGVSQGHSGSSGPTAGIGTDTFDFTFDWTAPATSVGLITITAAGLAINQNTLNDSGDQVYTTSLTVNPSTSTNPQILISRSTFNFPSYYSLPNSVGNSQVFWAAGQNLTGNLTVSVTGPQFMIASSASGPWVTSIPLTATGGVVTATPVYVQYTGPASGTQTGTVTVSGGGATSKSIPLSGVVRTGATAPTINTPTPAALNFGTVAVGSGNTTPQTFTFSFANPVGGMTVTCPPPFEVSTVSTYDYSNLLTPNFAGVGFTITAYVRMTNPKTAGTFTGNLTIAMPGATTQSVALSGTSTMPSQLVLSSIDYLSLFTTNPGTPSATQTISVTGTGLTANLDVMAPNNFEVSLSASTGFASSVSIAPTAGNVTPTTVYARYSRATAGLDAGNITLSNNGATTQNVFVNGDCFGSPTTSVRSVPMENGIAFFPNPGNGIVYIRTSNQTKDLFVSVIDINGKTILMERISSENEKIDLGDHPAGIYFAGIIDSNMNILAREKIVIVK
ncbi:MAG: choice-of-anchor V domain-containing protein [Bacteroidia bacterium]